MNKKEINFDGSCQDYLMRNNGFSVGFNMPEALSGDSTFGLPPYAKRVPFLVDKYPACPKDWLRSEGIIKSFFVPVKEDKGMWLDFNYNDSHTHHVAIVISVQGINPITGLPCKDAQLEQYIEECPKHKIKFGPDRYCSKCDYKWPKQNYVCTTGTPRGRLWIDGFRTAEGIVRQYILTAEKMRGVASNIIGKNRVYAIGLSFFVSKEKRERREEILRGGNILYSSPMSWDKSTYPSVMTTKYLSLSDSLDYEIKSGVYCSTSQTEIQMNDCRLSDLGISKSQKSVRYKKSIEPKSVSKTPLLSRSIQCKKLEVGAGAKIDQVVYDDPEKLDFWHDKPESIICINYCSEKETAKIINAGEVDLEGHEEGFLKNIPVGN